MKQTHTNGPVKAPPPRQAMVPVNESSHDKAIRLGVARMTAFRMRGRQIQALGRYDLDQEEREKLVDAAYKVAHAIKAALMESPKSKDRDAFTF